MMPETNINGAGSLTEVLELVSPFTICQFIIPVSTEYCHLMWSHNKGVVGGKTSRLRVINFCL